MTSAAGIFRLKAEATGTLRDQVVGSIVILYVIGVLIGLVVMRDPIGPRLATALVWPLGPIAFVVVLTILLAASAALWPVAVLGTAAVVGAVAWFVT